MSNSLLKWLLIAAATLLVLSIGGCTGFNMTFKFVDNYQLGYKFNATTGETTILPTTGWHRKRPFLDKINTIDLRPMQVCINANERVLNCKLVQFNPAGIKVFLSWHGRADYDQANMGEILKSYAYDGSGKNYPFLTVLRELKNEENDGPPVATTGPPPAPVEPPAVVSPQ